jgi:hypothetical protein
MAKNKDKEVARSQLMAQAEKLAGMGVTKALIVFIDPEDDVGLTITEGLNMAESVYILRAAEHMLFGPQGDEPEDGVD